MAKFGLPLLKSHQDIRTTKSITQQKASKSVCVMNDTTRDVAMDMLT